MKQHPPFLIFVPVLLFAGYLGWSLWHGTLHLRGRPEPIRRRDNPREYWYNMRILLVLFIIILGLITWMLA